MSASQELDRTPVNLKVWGYPVLRVAGKVSLGKLRGAAMVENSNRDQMLGSKNVEGLGGAQSGGMQ